MTRLWHDLHARRAAAATPDNWPRYLRTALPRYGNPDAPLDALVALGAERRVPSPHISPALRWMIWERDNFTCQLCGSRRFLAIDHIYPRSKGGPTVAENLQTLCKSCNSAKGDRA